MIYSIQHKGLHIVFLIFFFSSSFSQQKKLIQFSGRITNETGKPIDYAHVVDYSVNKGCITDKNGLFTLITMPKDSIVISCIGYKSKKLQIPDTLPDKHFILDISLVEDTLEIGEVRIFPWKTYEEFKQAFIALELDDDDYEHAQRNVALIYTQMLFDDTPIPTQTFKYMMQEQYERLYIQGQYPSTRLFDPNAWTEFIDALKNGKVFGKD